ncbi:hypothetical protein ACMFMG_000475 [Clarireedia jacksonii]
MNSRGREYTPSSRPTTNGRRGSSLVRRLSLSGSKPPKPRAEEPKLSAEEEARVREDVRAALKIAKKKLLDGFEASDRAERETITRKDRMKAKEGSRLHNLDTSEHENLRGEFRKGETNRIKSREEMMLKLITSLRDLITLHVVINLVMILITVRVSSGLHYPPTRSTRRMIQVSLNLADANGKTEEYKALTRFHTMLELIPTRMRRRVRCRVGLGLMTMEDTAPT